MINKYCMHCWGSGKVPDFWDNTKEVNCPYCDVTGKAKLQTNEEWFVNLSIEEKAEWLNKHSDFMYKCGKNHVPPKIMSKNEWQVWLKQPHKER